MTIKDIARESGYAVGTVSRVLNNQPGVSDAAREKIMEVVDRNHFRLNNNAKHLKQQASGGIAIIVKGTQNMLFASIVEQMQGLVKQSGIASIIYYIEEDDNELEQALQVCRERRPLGILFLGSNYEYFRDQFHKVEVPCVMVTNSAVGLGFDNLSSVGTDDVTAARAAVSHLIGKGHRKIGILGGKLGVSRPADTRLSGCKAVMDEHDIPFHVEQQYQECLFSMGSGYKGMERLMERMPDVSAVFAMSDVMAIGAISAITDHGLRVPQDISVIGFDGIDLGWYLTPKLATIRQQKEQIACRSVEILLAAIKDGAPAVHEVIPFELMDGGSVCCRTPQE